MRPLFADAVPFPPDDDPIDIPGTDRERELREELYQQWRRTRVLFIHGSAAL